MAGNKSMKITKCRLFSILLVFLILMTTCSVNTHAWDRGGKKLSDRSEIKGVSFVNPKYDENKTQFISSKGDVFEDSVKGRSYKISEIYDSKEFTPKIVVYPKYLYLKCTNTYYDLKLTATTIYSNKTEASFLIGKKPKITVNEKVGNWKPTADATTSIKVLQEIKVSAGQKKVRPLTKLKYYVGVSDLDSYEGIKYYGKYTVSKIHKPKSIKNSTCEYKKSDSGITVCGMNTAEGNDETTKKKHLVYFDNGILKSKSKTATSALRFGNIGGAGKSDTYFKFFVENPDLAKEKTTATIDKAIKFAQKYASKNSYHYVNYEPDDKKTQMCPVCHPEIIKSKKYKGWNCIGFVSACYHHAGVKSVQCRGGGIVNDYFAGYSRLTERSFRDRNGKNWDLIAKQNSRIPTSKLKKGDVIICYSNSTFKHVVMYAGGGYIYDSTSGSTQISKRKYSSLGVTPKVAFRFRIAKL